MAAAVRPGAGQRRALLVGIDDYTASHLPRPAARGALPPAPGRDWPNLGGAVNDALAMQEMLVARYGFAPHDIVTLIDQAATRAAILRALEDDLLGSAGQGDVLLFYFGGHGSQVRNLASDEPDKLDESLVPADSRLGARDIRDKELRRLFNRILDRGARLTVILDSCHSGSGARGLPTGARPRGVNPDLRDVADGADPGPPPEDRGALVLAAAQDFDFAWETWDELGKRHGVFSWAWMRAMRDAAADEPAIDTFLRADARMRAETPFQQPVLAGNAAMRLSPFLGERQGGEVRRARAWSRIAVEQVEGDGTIDVAGGWAHGLSPGSELRPVAQGSAGVRLVVTEMRGLGRCRARLAAGPPRSPLAAGALLEIAGWAAPEGRVLRVWMPRLRGPATAAVELARGLASAARKGAVRWIDDPTERSPSHILRWRDEGWELLGPDGAIAALGFAASTGTVLAQLPPGSSLFMQLPAPASLLQGIAVGAGTAHSAVEPTERPEEADYILAGRLAGDRLLEYAWLRPAARGPDQRRTALPLRTAWQPLRSLGGAPDAEAALVLEDAVLRLHKIQAWHLLDSPPAARSAYRLVIRRARNGEALKEPVVLTGKEEYGLVLQARYASGSASFPSRYFYVFEVDSYGKSVLLFPTGNSGSVENRFPLPRPARKAPAERPAEIPLGPPALFAADEPYGMDTYFLLSTDEDLPNPWIFEWPGVRPRGPQGQTALEELLSVTGGTTRSASRVSTPANWSIERLLVESVSPAGGAKGVR
ncbi:MAG TPA: caspase family protein [Thermoanaerobaculia bacterium]|nr:caspase family protein [Thermoanaerobaculia bacterium]